MRLSSRELAAAALRAARAFLAAGVAPRRSRRDLGAEHLGVDRRRARPAVGRRRARAAQHALQGRRGRLRPAQESARACCCTVGEFLGTRLRRARCAARRCPTLERIVMLRGDGARRRRADAGATFLAARRDASPTPAARARADARRARRPLRHPLHLGHHRQAEGRDDDARAEPARASRPGATSSGCARATATWS